MKFLQRIVTVAIRFVYTTIFIQRKRETLPSHGIVAIWHDELLGVTKALSKRGGIIMISPSRDGRKFSAFLKHWGYDFIFGSPFKNGKEALQKAVELSKERLVILAVDGSRGPRHTMKAGAVVAAMRAEVPLYLCRATGVGFRLRSWDKFQILFPFTCMKLKMSEPIHVSNTLSREEVDEIIVNCERELKNGNFK